jgi:hypothetical protein
MYIWDCIKLKSFYYSRGHNLQSEEPEEHEKILASYSSDRRLVSKILKSTEKCKHQENKKSNIKWTNEMNSYFSNEEMQMSIDTGKNIQYP